MNLVISGLKKMASELQNFGVIDVHDLSGRMFQQLIADRKFLAAYYTLLAELAISRLRVDWGDAEQIAGLRIGDFACGTGTLLGASYHAISSMHRRANGHDGELHAHMMERVMVGGDIMPASVHLTAETLSGMYPGSDCEDTERVTMEYGKAEDGYKIGSLDLIMDDHVPDVISTGRKGISGKQGVKEGQVGGKRLEVPHGSMDVVVMNPPFTRLANHERWKKTKARYPAFAGFRTTEEDHDKMSLHLKEIAGRLRRGHSVGPGNHPASHGNAGLGSNFIDLSHAKLRPGGVLALVIPLTFVQGGAWSNARDLIRRHYKDILVVGIAAGGEKERAFPADTGMAEIRLVVTKRKACTEDRPHRDKYGAGWKQNLEDISIATLPERPRAQLEAATTARMIEHCGESGGRLSEGWKGKAVKGSLLVPCMTSLAAGELLLPRMGKPVSLPACLLGKLGKRGRVSKDISGTGKDNKKGNPRGTLDVRPLSLSLRDKESPILWGHDYRRETRLTVAPDRQCVPKEECREKAAEWWSELASRLYININFQLTSQPLVACLTEEISLGGGWSNFNAQKEEWEVPIALWTNTTTGLISFWRAGTSQQLGRARLTVTRHPELLVLDPRELMEERLTKCGKIFQKFRQKEFSSAKEARSGRTRQELDEAMLVDLLGRDERILKNLEILRNQWCSEPSVCGGKKTACQIL